MASSICTTSVQRTELLVFRCVLVSVLAVKSGNGAAAVATCSRLE